MTVTACDMTHRAYELALGEGLGFWERSAAVSAHLAGDPATTGRRGIFGGARKQKAAPLMLHTFDGGVVVERHRGGVLGVAYDALAATVIDIEPSGSGQEPEVGLLLTLGDNRTLALVASQPVQAREFTELAGRCGTCARAGMGRREARVQLQAPDWI